MNRFYFNLFTLFKVILLNFFILTYFFSETIIKPERPATVSQAFYVSYKYEGNDFLTGYVLYERISL
jgi:hypothetical protein